MHLSGHHIVIDGKRYHVHTCKVCKLKFLTVTEPVNVSRCPHCRKKYRKWVMNNLDNLYPSAQQEIADAARTAANT